VIRASSLLVGVACASPVATPVAPSASASASQSAGAPAGSVAAQIAWPQVTQVHAVGMAVLVVDNRAAANATFSYNAAGMTQATIEVVTSHGVFTLRVPPGHYSFSVSVPGSQKRDLELGLEGDNEYRFRIDP
jgi:hypothetical protein